MKKDPWVLDFETKSITAYPRPGSPPPGGLAFLKPGGVLTYAAWGHPIGNGVYTLKGRTLTKLAATFDPRKVAETALRDAFKWGRVLGHNIAKFDLPVAEDHFPGLQMPAWEGVDDTMFQAFLSDPHAVSLSLKPLAERVLGEEPTERDAVYDWLAEHGVIPPPRKVKGKLVYAKDAGAHILEAPGSLVAKYAIGDLTRSKGLHDKFFSQIAKLGMMDAYRREQALVPVLLDNERRGLCVDMARLEQDIPKFQAAFKTAEEWIRKRLKSPSLNIDSDDDVADALRKTKIVREFPKTATGKDSVSKKNLTIEYYSDPKVFHALFYRNTMSTVLKQSMEKWYTEGSLKKGRIHRDWAQVRQNHGDDNKGRGARSGRVTVSGLANIAKRFGGKDPTYEHPAFMKVPEPPLARDYILPDKGEIFGHSDFDQQEMKITAHYEDGSLAEAYRNDPKMDAHVFVHDLIQKVCGKDYNRDIVKIVDFRTSYGGGVAGLAEQLRIPYNEAKEIITNWKKALPDVVGLDTFLKGKFKAGDYIRTLGGRVYYCKPPAVAKKGPRKGQRISFEYTALNYLIQPSAADQTKQALIDYYNHPKRQARLLCTVYDEINISMAHPRELAVLQECMVNAFKLDVPVTTTLKMGERWGRLEKVNLVKGRVA